MKSEAFRQGLLDAVQTDAQGFTKLCYSGLVKEPLGTDGGLDVLKRILRTTKKLAELRLPSCKLGAMGAAHLAVTIALDQTLTVLDLSRNNLKTEGALHVARAMKNCSIEKVFLGDNGIDSACPELWSLLLTGPRVVSLFGNRDIKSKGVMDMVAVIESGVCKCEKLDLGDCGVKQVAGEAMVMAVSSANSMKAIVLERNDFGLRISIDALPSSTGLQKEKSRKKTNRFTLMAGTSEAGGSGSGSGGASGGAGGGSGAGGSNIAVGGVSDPSAAFVALLRSTSLTEIKVPLSGTPEMQEFFAELLRMTASQNVALQELTARGSSEKDGMLIFKSRMWRAMPEQVLKPTWVTVLDLRKNFLSGLPYSITALKSLTALDVSSNLIDVDSVPLHLSTLKRLKVLRIDDNPFVTWQVDPQSPSVSLVAMKSQAEERVSCSFLKAIVIGQEAVGKTTLVDTLYRSLNDEGLMKHQLAKWKKRFQERKEGRHWTDGIEICQTTLPSADPHGAPLTLSIWDFAGQAVYYPTHQLFLPEKAVFIVVFDLSSPPSMARVHYWLDSIVSNVKMPAIVLVGTHKDKCSNWEELCEQVRARHASRRDLDIRGVFAIRATQMGDMGPIKQALQNVAAAPKMKEWIGRKFPRSYTFLASIIREENLMTRNPIMSRSEFRKVAASCNVLSEEDFEECLSWLSYVGAIMTFPRLLALREQIFLSPHWLVSVMSRLVTWRSDALVAVVGTFFDDDIPALWPTKYFPENLRETIISLLTHFEILHPLTESDSPASSSFQRVFIVPCMLPEEEPPFVSPGLEGRTYVRRFSFSFAPFGMFPQLLIRMMALCRAHLELWKWGMVGILRAAGSRHLVRVKGSFDPSGKGDVDFTITTNDESGLVLHIIISPFESLLRSCYPNAKPKRYVSKPGTQEAIEIDNWMQAGKDVVDEHGDIGALAPDLALQSTLHVNLSDLEMGRELARGSFGSINCAKLKGREVVVKQLFEADAGSAYQELLRECWMMSFLDHVNVIALLGVCMSPLSIVMELANSGDLRAFLDGHKDLPIFVRLKLLVDVASGMNYAHSQTPPVIHMDLKSPNILVQRDDEGVLTAKVADLGLATVFAYSLKHEAADNPRWLAPEAIRGEKISRKADVYSFAIIMWEMMTNKFPYAAEESHFPFSYQFANAIANGLRPPVDDVAAVAGVPSLFIPLMDRAWAPDPLLRPTFLECLQSLYQMIDQTGIPTLYEAKQATASQLGVINCSSLSYVDQVVSWIGSDQEVSVLHSDGLLSHYQISDGQLLWSANLREENPAVETLFMCTAPNNALWVCDGHSSTVTIFSPHGMRETRTSPTMRSVCEMVATDSVIVWAGQGCGATGGFVLETYLLETGKKIGGSPVSSEFRTLFCGLAVTCRRPRTMKGSSERIAAVPSMTSSVWFLQQDSGGGASKTADSMLQMSLETGELFVVRATKSVGFVFLVAVDDVVWVFDASGGVNVFNAVTREHAGAFSLHEPILNAVYVPAIHRVVAISRSQSLCIVDPEFKTVRVVVKSVPVAFGLASRALCVVRRGQLGQVLVGGESVCIFKVHRMKQPASGTLARPVKPLPSKTLEIDLNSIKKLDAMSINSTTLSMSTRQSVVSDAMEDIIRDLASSASLTVSGGTNHAESPAVAPLLKSPPMLKRQESAFIDDSNFESMIRDLEQPMQKAKGRTAAAAAVAPAAAVTPARTLSRPSKPLPPSPMPPGSASPSVAAGAPGGSPPQVSSGTRIRTAYGVKEKVRVRPSKANDVYSFRIETERGLIGWGRKEDDQFVFLDQNGVELLRLAQAEMESAKKPPSRPSSLVGAKPTPPAAPAPRPGGPARPVAPPRPTETARPKSNNALRQHLISNPEVQETIFMYARKYEQERLMLQFCGWANVFENVVDLNVRYELACKLYFEFLYPDPLNQSRLPLLQRVYDSLVRVLQPLMDADDMDAICELPADFFHEAVLTVHARVRDEMYGPCVREMRDRLKVLELKAERNVMSRVESKELSALAICVRLTFEEFLAVLAKYREVVTLRQPETKMQIGSPPSIPLSLIRQTPPSSGASTPKAVPLRLTANSPRGSGMNSPIGSRHGSLGNEEEGPRPPPRLAETPLSRSSGARHNSVTARASARTNESPRHGSFGSEVDLPVAPPRHETAIPASRTSARSRESGDFVIPIRAGSTSNVTRDEIGSPAVPNRSGSTGNVARESQRDEYVICSPRTALASKTSPRKAPPSIPVTPPVLSPPPRAPPSRFSNPRTTGGNSRVDEQQL